MLPKPAHLGPAYAAVFTDPSVAAAYPHRPPYPPELFDLLLELIPAGPRVVLDIGCGTGDLARPLAARVDRVDAVDPSAAMMTLGRALPGGAAPRLRWIEGRLEDAPLRPPYTLVTAGESLHWMDWPVALPRLAAVLAPGRLLAIVKRDEIGSPWRADLGELLGRYSTNRDYQPYDLIAELEGRALFRPVGQRQVGLRPFAQPIDSYIESIHSRNGFSRERMTETAAAAFDAAVRRLLAGHAQDGIVQLRVAATVVWGVPVAG